MLTTSPISTRKDITAFLLTTLQAMGKLLNFKPKGSKPGFTLIELLLVVVLISITLGIAAPYFVRSIQGHRLSTAARTLVTVARYSRSMALLKQSELAITFNLDTGHIDLVSSNTTLPRFSRTIQGVRLVSVEIKGSGGPVTEGICTIPYSRTGICVPFSAKVKDKKGSYVVVEVDALSSVRTFQYEAD